MIKHFFKKHRWLIYLILVIFIPTLIFSKTSFVLGQAPQTLFVSIAFTAGDPSNPVLGVSMIGSVFGTATGPINYIFYCNRTDDGTNITSGWAHRVTGTNLTTYITPTGICDSIYLFPGFYTAKVIVERGGVVAESRIGLTVIDRNPPQVTAFDVQPRVTLGPVTATWTIIDPMGVSQVELWRTTDGGGFPDPNSWALIYSRNVSGQTTDSPPLGIYWYGLHALDQSGNIGNEPSPIMVTIAAPDTAPPVRSNGSPSGQLPAGTTQTALSLSTNENATCRYSTSPGINYSSMTNTFSGAGSVSHSVTISGLQNGQNYSYYIRCIDAAGNTNNSDYIISFSVASPPAPVCGDGSCNGAETCSTCPGDCGTCPPACGDGSCNGAETCSTCSQDCGVCPPPPLACGDGSCNGTETCSSCPGDCGTCAPACPDGSCNGSETCSSCPQDCGTCPPACGDGSCNGTETCSTCAQDCGSCLTTPPSNIPDQGSSSGGFIRVENPLKQENVEGVINAVAGILRVIAVGIGILMIIIAGIIIMTSAGDKDKLELGKRILKWTLVGVAITLSASFILELIKELIPE